MLRLYFCGILHRSGGAAIAFAGIWCSGRRPATVSLHKRTLLLYCCHNSDFRCAFIRMRLAGELTHFKLRPAVPPEELLSSPRRRPQLSALLLTGLIWRQAFIISLISLSLSPALVCFTEIEKERPDDQLKRLALTPNMAPRPALNRCYHGNRIEIAAALMAPNIKHLVAFI